MQEFPIIALNIKKVILIYKKASPRKVIDFTDNSELKRGLSFGKINKLTNEVKKNTVSTCFDFGIKRTTRNNDFIFHKIINSFVENKQLTINDFK